MLKNLDLAQFVSMGKRALVMHPLVIEFIDPIYKVSRPDFEVGAI